MSGVDCPCSCPGMPVDRTTPGDRVYISTSTLIWYKCNSQEPASNGLIGPVPRLGSNNQEPVLGPRSDEQAVSNTVSASVLLRLWGDEQAVSNTVTALVLPRLGSDVQELKKMDVQTCESVQSARVWPTKISELRIYDCICQLVITMGLWTVGQAFCDVRVVSIIVKGSFRKAILSIIRRIIE